jgi:hypothetical protein
MPMADDKKKRDTTEEVEDRGGIGAEGGDESENAETLPGAPAEDETPLGDTDQHSQVPTPPRTGR